MKELLLSLIPWRRVRDDDECAYTVFDWSRGPHCAKARAYPQKGGGVRYRCQHPGRVVS